MRIIQWHRDADLDGLPAETIVRAVPLAHPLFDLLKYNMGHKHAKNPPWWKTVHEIEKAWSERRAHPIWYCQQHKRMEDGGHRAAAATRLGVGALDVYLSHHCYQGSLLCRQERQVRSAKKPKELAWLLACAWKKWPLFDDDIDWTGKTVLDVGCNHGYSCFRAHELGARLICGRDVREDMLALARNYREARGLPESEVKFEASDITNGAKGVFDIVLCMGLLHYFARPDYAAVLRRLASKAREVLVIEIAYNDAPGISLAAKGSRTLATREWMQGFLGGEGFAVKREEVITRGRRCLWVAVRERAG